MKSVIALALVLIGALWAGTAEAQTVVFLDNCNNSGGSPEAVTAQTNHTTSTGTSPFWTEVVDEAGTIQVNADPADYCVASNSSASNALVWTLEPSGLASADYDVLFTFSAVVTGHADDDHLGFGGRYTDTSHFYACIIDADTAPVDWRIVKRNGTAINAGASTTLASGTATFAATDIVKCSFRGDTIKFFQNAVQLGCIVDADLATQGKAAIFWGDFATTSTADIDTGWRLDDIKVQTDGSLTDDNCGASTTRNPGVGFGLIQ